MTVTIADPIEWQRVLANVRPSPLYVSSNFEWFRNGFGIIYRLVRPQEGLGDAF